MLFEKKKGFVQKMLPTILIVRLTVHIIILQVPMYNEHGTLRTLFIQSTFVLAYMYCKKKYKKKIKS